MKGRSYWQPNFTVYQLEVLVGGHIFRAQPSRAMLP